jgi:hypothetical protein
MVWESRIHYDRELQSTRIATMANSKTILCDIWTEFEIPAFFIHYAFGRSLPTSLRMQDGALIFWVGVSCERGDCGGRKRERILSMAAALTIADSAFGVSDYQRAYPP